MQTLNMGAISFQENSLMNVLRPLRWNCPYMIVIARHALITLLRYCVFCLFGVGEESELESGVANNLSTA